jgi:hypothetical protein
LQRMALGVFLWFLALVLTLPSVALAQQVSPYQTGHYYPGVMNIRDLASAPAGTYLGWGNMFGVTSEYYDRDGNLITQIPIGDPPTDVDISVQTGSANIAFVLVRDLGGNFRYMGSIVTPLLYVNSGVSLSRGGYVPGKSEFVDVSGIGDLALSPVSIIYGKDRFDVTGGYTVYIPTGKYTTGAPDNIGLGFTTHQFQAAGYMYFLQKASALMLTLTYELNSHVYDADVNPGDRFSLDYGISHFVNEWLELGVFGGNNWQITDDTGSDVIWDGSVHDSKAIIGGLVGVWPTKWFLITIKRSWEYNVRGRFKVDGYQINLGFVLGASE